MKRTAGVTLLEVLIAVTLLSLLSAGMMMAMRIGISALGKTDSRLMENRRVAGAQRILQQELEALIPVVAPCANGGAETAVFSGQTSGVTLVTSFSLQEAWRGRPQIIQIFTIPDDSGGGARLVVNETPYLGPEAAGKLCTGVDNDPEGAGAYGHFAPPTAGPNTFVLADHLRGVRYSFLRPPEKADDPPRWDPVWTAGGWPAAIRIEMAPLEPSPGRLQPITVTAPMFIYRDPKVKYADE